MPKKQSIDLADLRSFALEFARAIGQQIAKDMPVAAQPTVSYDGGDAAPLGVRLVDKLSLSPEEASALSGIGLTRIREAISTGRLVAHKHGTRTIVLPDDLKAWLKAMPLADK